MIAEEDIDQSLMEMDETISIKIKDDRKTGIERTEE